MSRIIKTQNNILSKLGIEKLNPMQEEAKKVINAKTDIVTYIQKAIFVIQKIILMLKGFFIVSIILLLNY